MLTKYQQFFTGRPTEKIAQALLGKQITYTNADGITTGGLIVETEAYLGENDSASHAYNGRRTNYSESLYGNPGNIYLYQIRAITALTWLFRMPKSLRESLFGG